MTRAHLNVWLTTLAVLWVATSPPAGAQRGAADTLPTPRLYVLEGGVLVSDPGRYQLRDDEVASEDLAIAAYLIVHPDGVLLWDTLGIGDEERIPGGTGAQQTIIRSDMEERHVTLGPPLVDQLAGIGYAMSDVTHLALSHFHWDHTANANAFASATWLVRPDERDVMFSDAPGGSARPMTYDRLKGSQTILVTDEEFDVFGDGTVILKAAPGHTPGHQVLYVNLPRLSLLFCDDGRGRNHYRPRPIGRPISTPRSWHLQLQLHLPRTQTLRRPCSPSTA